MSYAELLKDPRWQKKRLEVLEAAGWRCVSCWSTEKTLNVHHRKYRAGAMPWEYENEELEVLCEDCHSLVHECRRVLHNLVDSLAACSVKAVTGYAQAMFAGGVKERKYPVRVLDEDHASGIAAALGVFHLGSVAELGGAGWIMEKARESGSVDPWELHKEQWEWWRETGNALYAEKKTEKVG